MDWELAFWCATGIAVIVFAWQIWCAEKRRRKLSDFKSRVVDGLRAEGFRTDFLCTCREHVLAHWCILVSSDHDLIPDATVQLLGKIVLAAADPADRQWGSVWHEWRPLSKSSRYHVLLQSND